MSKTTKKKNQCASKNLLYSCCDKCYYFEYIKDFKNFENKLLLCNAVIMLLYQYNSIFNDDYYNNNYNKYLINCVSISVSGFYV